MQTIKIKGQQFNAVMAQNLKNGMVYWDGSVINSVAISGKTVKFNLAGVVDRVVRSSSLIAVR